MLTILSFALLASISVLGCEDNGYSMYVWRSAFDPNADHCNGIYPPNKEGDNASCFYHAWESPEARQKLWASCTISGREVTRIFLADVKGRIENGGLNGDNECDANLSILLNEAHDRGISVYALFAVDDAAFSETYMARYPNLFNQNCGDDSVYFDGVAVNNEYFSDIKACNETTDENNVNVAEQQVYLDNLQLAVHNAFPLPLHYSVSWNWDCCSCSSATYRTRELLWPAANGVMQPVLKHMLDIVDSVDVQVAYNLPSVMADRSSKAYQYWLEGDHSSSETSKVYVLAYTNPNSLCQLSFSPHTEGSSSVEDVCQNGAADRTERGMFDAFDFVESRHTQAKGGIHFMGGVFGTGITEQWPVHSSNPSLGCLGKWPSAHPSQAIAQNPTIAPTATNQPCYDNHRQFLYLENKITCKAVWYNKEELCNNIELQNQCPITCRKDGCMCTDKTWPFMFKSKKKKWCNFVQKKNTAKRCKRNKLRSFCPDTCICNPPQE